MFDPPPQQKSPSPGTILLTLPFLYFFSYGPLSLIYYNTGFDVYDFFYDLFFIPMDLLYDYTPLDRLIDWWEEVWT